MSQPDPAQFPGIRAYIQREAGSRSLEGIRDYVASRYDAIFAATRALPPERLASPPSENEWSPLEALKHFVEWNWQAGEDILHASLMGERPNNPAPTFAPDLDGLIARARESLDSIWAHVSAADPGGFLELTWEHPFFGELNWREWYFFLGIHAIDHTRQIEAANG